MNGVRLAWAAVVRLAFRIGRLAPVRRRVVLATSHAAEIGGNLATIREELARRFPDLRIVELAQRPTIGWLERPAALLHSLRAGYHLATARVFIVDDYFFPMYVIEPRRGTTRVQVWHACGALKKFGYSVVDKAFGLDETAVSRVPIHTNYDLCLVSAMRFASFYAEAFRQPLERFTARLGIPRTDLFFDSERTAAVSGAIRRRYGLSRDRRIVLYAPTFRGERITLARAPEKLDLRLLRDALGSDHVLLLRDHPFVRARLKLEPDLEGFVVDVSDHPELNDLMLVSDVLVTDYSSAMFEFALLERPMAFFAPDLEAYERERGFYVDYRTWVPGPVFETTAALAEWLRAGQIDYPRIRRFRREAFDVADGHAAERFVQRVVLPVLAGERLR